MPGRISRPRPAVTGRFSVVTTDAEHPRLTLGCSERDHRVLTTVATCADRQLVWTTTPDAGAHHDPGHGGLPVLSATGQSMVGCTR
jgi:hypothetical protein